MTSGGIYHKVKVIQVTQSYCSWSWAGYDLLYAYIWRRWQVFKNPFKKVSVMSW